MSETNENKGSGLDRIENSALIQAMKALKKNEDRETFSKFIIEAKKAKFITPATVEGEGSEKTVKIEVLKSKKGEILVPAYTGTEELIKQYKEKPQSIVCDFNQYIKMVTSEQDGPVGLVIDPSGENILINREIMKAIRDEDRMRIGDFKEEQEPEELKNALKRFFDEEGTIESAYLFVTLKLGQINLLLVIDNRYPDGATKDEVSKIREDLYSRIAEAVKPEFEEYKNQRHEHKGLGLVIADTYMQLGREAAANREPFYRK